MNILGFVLLVLVGIPLFILYNGYCDMMLWNWFISPLGLPVLDIPKAIGVSIAISAIAVPKTFQQADEKAALAVALISPGACLFFGWIVRMFL